MGGGDSNENLAEWMSGFVDSSSSKPDVKTQPAAGPYKYPQPPAGIPLKDQIDFYNSECQRLIQRKRELTLTMTQEKEVAKQKALAAGIEPDNEEELSKLNPHYSEAQSALVENQELRRFVSARREEVKQQSQASLQDYQAQLMALEKQNIKRIAMARQMQYGFMTLQNDFETPEDDFETSEDEPGMSDIQKTGGEMSGSVPEKEDTKPHQMTQEQAEAQMKSYMKARFDEARAMANMYNRPSSSKSNLNDPRENSLHSELANVAENRHFLEEMRKRQRKEFAEFLNQQDSSSQGMNGMRVEREMREQISAQHHAQALRKLDEKQTELEEAMRRLRTSPTSRDSASNSSSNVASQTSSADVLSFSPSGQPSTQPGQQEQSKFTRLSDEEVRSHLGFAPTGAPILQGLPSAQEIEADVLGAYKSFAISERKKIQRERAQERAQARRQQLQMLQIEVQKLQLPKPPSSKELQMQTPQQLPSGQQLPKEPELAAEKESLQKKKEILFCRHKLQKGLLHPDQAPKEEDMKQMSDFISKLEGYADVEVSILKGTKVDKVLEAVMKLNFIPKEEEFHFKPRSQALLRKWSAKMERHDRADAEAQSTQPSMAQANLSRLIPEQHKPNITAPVNEGSLQDSQMQLMLLEQQNEKRLAMARAERDAWAQEQAKPTPAPAMLQNYEMQLMLLEQQNKKRCAMARAGQDSPAEEQAKPALAALAAPKLQDYQMQLMLLEQQNKKRIAMANAERAEEQAKPAPASAMLQGYEMQLMLLEQQNKKRCAMAKAGQDSRVEEQAKPAPAPAPAMPQLMLLEQQNKKRLAMARKEQDSLPDIQDGPSDSEKKHTWQDYETLQQLDKASELRIAQLRKVQTSMGFPQPMSMSSGLQRTCPDGHDNNLFDLQQQQNKRLDQDSIDDEQGDRKRLMTHSAQNARPTLPQLNPQKYRPMATCEYQSAPDQPSRSLPPYSNNNIAPPPGTSGCLPARTLFPNTAPRPPHNPFGLPESAAQKSQEQSGSPSADHCPNPNTHYPEHSYTAIHAPLPYSSEPVQSMISRYFSPGEIARVSAHNRKITSRAQNHLSGGVSGSPRNDQLQAVSPPSSPEQLNVEIPPRSEEKSAANADAESDWSTLSTPLASPGVDGYVVVESHGALPLRPVGEEEET